MKTILVPTDFSEVSQNSIDYAVEIAKATEAKLILFHAYHLPMVASEVPVAMPSLDEMGKDCIAGLKKIEENIHLKTGNKINIECVCKCGFAVDEINQFAKEQDIDLIIMGMQGGGYLSEKLIGSVTTTLIQETKKPVLAIDKQVKFNGIKRIVFASDYQKIQDLSVLNSLKEFADIFKSHIYILNVVPELEIVPSVDKAAEGVKLGHSFENTDHSFHYIENENVADGINAFVAENKIDLVAMIPRHHSALANIFREPNTKKLAFHIRVPLLALHE